MSEKRLVVTRADSNCERLIAITHPTIKCYAERWKADFMVLDHKEEWMTDYELAHYRILKVGKLLEQYERILIIDSDIVIMPECPNPFEMVDPEKIGSIYEDVGSRQDHRRQVIKDIQAKHGDVGWKEGYINTGVFVVSKKHKNIFRKIQGSGVGHLWTGFGYDDALIGYNIHTEGFEIQELPFQWNHMSLFSEPWNNSANRFNSYIIHYAGAANFPDDQSGRLKGSNLESRCRLITSDTDRIVEGLSGFTVTGPTPKQGLGSTTYNALIGVNEKEIVVKHHKTPDGLERECRAFDGLDIPYIVDCYGVSEGADGNRYMMLQKLRDLQDVIDQPLMSKIATCSLIALRQLYKHDIPWICKLDHIMLNNAGEPRLIDFNDEECPAIPFYGKEGKEAIIMEGECAPNGQYKQRYTYPRSGWLAVMKYLCEKNSLPFDCLSDAENAMIAYEYQALENVHQPIYHYPYSSILRRETEKDDPKYGKLVKPNRDCIDRSNIILKNILIEEGQTWLDIGCNVGWFCFHFQQWYKMTGVDSDKDKIEFATMLAQGNSSSAKFEASEINLEYVENMPSYDIISALSILHLKLVEDKDKVAFWELFKAVSEKVNDILFLEFPPHAYKLLSLYNTREFIMKVVNNGKFKEVTQIGVSDAGRPVLKCVKGD